MKHFKQTFVALTDMALTNKDAELLIEALRKDYEDSLEIALSDAFDNEGESVELYDHCVFPERFSQLLPRVQSVRTDRGIFDVEVDFDCLDDFANALNEDERVEKHEQKLKQNGHYN